MKQFLRRKHNLRLPQLSGLLVVLALAISACASSALQGTVVPEATQPLQATSAASAATPASTLLPGTGNNATPTAEPEVYSADILILDNSFVPSTMTVPQGAKVIWRNGGKQAHSVTAEDGLFDSGPINPGATFEFTFNQQGTFKYVSKSGTGATEQALAGQIVVTQPPPPTK